MLAIIGLVILLFILGWMVSGAWYQGLIMGALAIVGGGSVTIYRMFKGTHMVSQPHSMTTVIREPEKQASYDYQTPVFDPELFEGQVAEMFRRYGYKVVETPYQGDHGVDLKVMKPNEYAVVQCKRFSTQNKVGEPIVRDFFGVMQHEGADNGYIITTSDFTDQAIQWAKGKRIIMVNGMNLRKMLDETHMMEGLR